MEEEVPNDQAEDRQKVEAQPKTKKTWETPRIQSGTLFEANTVSCAKQPGNPQCVVGPPSA
jgi:hypothetical protein